MGRCLVLLVTVTSDRLEANDGRLYKVESVIFSYLLSWHLPKFSEL